MVIVDRRGTFSSSEKCVTISKYFLSGGMFSAALLFEAGAECDLFAEGGEDGFAVFAFGGGEEHAVGLEAAHLAGGEVGDDDDAATDEFFGGVPLGYAGEDLAFFVTEIDFEAEELVGFGDALGDDDFGDAEVDFHEVVHCDLWGVGDGGGCGCGGEGS